jgi:hypothetical protein
MTKYMYNTSAQGKWSVLYIVSSSLKFWMDEYNYMAAIFVSNGIMSCLPHFNNFTSYSVFLIAVSILCLDIYLENCIHVNEFSMTKLSVFVFLTSLSPFHSNFIIWTLHTYISSPDKLCTCVSYTNKFDKNTWVVKPQC